MKRNVMYGICGLLLVMVGAMLFAYPQAVATGASRGLSICGTVLIPALLPFLVVTGTFMRLSLCGTVARWLRRPTARLLRLPGVCAAPLLLSMVGGYPTGAVAVNELLENGSITEREAARMMHICVNAGPAFVVGAVGTVLLGDVRVGWLLFAAHLFASLCIGLAEAVLSPRPSGRRPHKTAYLPPLAAFADAVRHATETMLSLCGFVVLFSVLLSLSDGCGLSNAVGQWLDEPSVLSGLLEVSGGCVALAGERERSMFLFGFFLGFGGFSVHCQVRAILQRHPDALRRFFFFRLLHGVLGGFFSAALYRVIPLPITTLARNSATVTPFVASPAVSVALLLMCVCFFLYPFEKKIAKSR